MDYNDQNTDIHELEGKSPEFRTQLAKQLEDLVPEAIADGKVDVAKLKELLAEDAGDTNERFGLFWPGKKRAMRAAQDSTTATLKPAPELSKDWDTTNNIFIEGDNLEVLKVLQKQYHNAIKMIYIDPPYNTGKDFVYPDNFKEGLQNYLEFSKQVDEGNKKISTNTETVGRYHSNWLNMMYPRLKLARNLLTDQGFLFVSIGEEEVDNLKKLCFEVFGEDNFINTLTVRRQDKNLNTQFIQEGLRSLNTGFEYVLVFARSSKAKVNPVRTAVQNQDRATKGYWKGFWNSPDRPTMRYDILGFTPSEGQWKWERGKALEAIENYRVYQNSFADKMSLEEYWLSTGKKLSFIRRQEGSKGKHSGVDQWIAPAGDKLRTTSWNDILAMHKPLWLNLPFDSPKNPSLIRELIKFGADRDSLVLDFFSGSGTTAHAVMQLNAEDGGNRKHIQVQLPEPTDEKSEAYKAGYKKLSDIARERINRAGEKIKTDFADKLAERDTPLDVGYRTFKLSDTNFTKWQSAATSDLGELQSRLDLMRESSDDSASEADLLVEVMLKMGLPLTSRTEQREVSGLSVHQVIASADDEDSDTQPVFYLNEHVRPTLEQLRAIVTELTPSRFVILDDAFQGDNQLKTNLVQTCKSYDVELWTV